MTLSSFSSLFLVSPFGFEGEDEAPQTPDAGAPVTLDAGQTQTQLGQPAGPDDGDDDEFSGLTEAELKAHLKQISQQHKTVAAQAAEYKKAQDAAERAKNDELTNTQNDLKVAQGDVDVLRQTNSHLALVNSILNHPDYQWHNVEIVAQQVLSAGGVEVDPKTGKIEGINKALKAVAKDHAYLLRTPQNGGNNNGQQNGQPGRFTGVQPGQGGANGGNVNEPNTADLSRNYPALNSLG